MMYSLFSNLHHRSERFIPPMQDLHGLFGWTLLICHERCSARFESLLADFSGRDLRVEVGMGSMISFSAGRLREVVVDEVMDNVDDCEVKEGVVEVV